MDTGKRLWKVNVRGCCDTFNIMAPSAEEAVRKALLCAEDLGVAAGSADVTRVESEGTLDEPRRRRKARA